MSLIRHEQDGGTPLSFEIWALRIIVTLGCVALVLFIVGRVDLIEPYYEAWLVRFLLAGPVVAGVLASWGGNIVKFLLGGAVLWAIILGLSPIFAFLIGEGFYALIAYGIWFVGMIGFSYFTRRGGTLPSRVST